MEGSGFGNSEDVDIDPSIAMTTDVELLKRAWRNEKAAPEILQFQSGLVQRAREQIQLMVTFHNFTSFLVSQRIELEF